MTHTKEQRDLLNTIIANPEDDAPRLVYADWLDENDGTEECTKCSGEGWLHTLYRLAEMDKNEHCSTSARCEVCDGKGLHTNRFAELAEFIRVQCELANASGCDLMTGGKNCDEFNKKLSPYKTQLICHKCNRIEWLKRRQEQLLGFAPGGGSMRQYNWKEWFGNAINFIHRSGRKEDVLKMFRRGFVEQIACTMSDWMMYGPEIVQDHPITHVALSDFKTWTGQSDPDNYFIFDAGHFAGLGIGDGVIDNGIFNQLKGKKHIYDKTKSLFVSNCTYATNDEALADLSQACIAWAKSVVKTNVV